MIDKLLEVLDRQEEPELAATNALAVYATAAARIEALQEIQTRAKDVLAEVIAATGKSDFDSDVARCYISKPSVSVSYDRKALDALCQSNEQIARWLAPHRKETERPGTLTIRRKG